MTTQQHPTRREVIQRALTVAGFTTLAGSGTLLAACSAPSEDRQYRDDTTFSPQDIAWLDEVAETILPATDTPGAKAAGVGPFIALMVTDTYSPLEQAHFHQGTQALEAECRQAHGSGFMQATPAQREALLTHLDKVAMVDTRDDPPHYFRMLKELTLLGYFTSEIGYTQAMRYVETPGRFDPCVDYRPGERTWARHA